MAVTKAALDIIVDIKQKISSSEDLRYISACIGAMHKQVHEVEGIVNVAVLSKGDRVILQGIKPKKMNGRQGTVDRIEHTRKGHTVWVDLDSILGDSRRVGVPAACAIKT